MNDMNAILRQAAGYASADEEQADPAPPSFDGGVRSPAPPSSSMGEWLHAAVLSKTADLPMDQALRQVRFEQNLKEN